MNWLLNDSVIVITGEVKIGCLAIIFSFFLGLFIAKIVNKTLKKDNKK